MKTLLVARWSRHSRRTSAPSTSTSCSRRTTRGGPQAVLDRAAPGADAADDGAAPRHRPAQAEKVMPIFRPATTRPRPRRRRARRRAEGRPKAAGEAELDAFEAYLKSPLGDVVRVRGQRRPEAEPEAREAARGTRDGRGLRSAGGRRRRGRLGEGRGGARGRADRARGRPAAGEAGRQATSRGCGRSSNGRCCSRRATASSPRPPVRKSPARRRRRTRGR